MTLRPSVLPKRHGKVLAAAVSVLVATSSWECLAATSTTRDSWLAREACKAERFRSQADVADSTCPDMDALASHARAALAGLSIPQERVERLNRLFFDEEGFRATQDLSSAGHLLLSEVLKGKKGYCVGLALVYLILAEKLQLPIHGVSAPKHVFLRWDDGIVRRNIELFQEGRSVPDEVYIRDQRIPQESIERGVFMANLTSKEFLGFLYQNLGVLESQAEHFDASRDFYKRALKLNPKLASAHYNLGNDFLKLGQYSKAIRAYNKALKLYADDPWALRNRGLAWKGLGKSERAEEDWRRAREIESVPK